ncbi:hypothetical protein [Fusobacterium ulcerans]|uniref:hypothetical protein n=1 Tax=Fusobacterium ulcerans TaxID=861 RepID=UPI002E778087|nr:hypothetical protein [Fusobacterium ulcerans]MEE0138001.1 hypothetical protein [Fusobacterium ulcerans]
MDYLKKRIIELEEKGYYDVTKGTFALETYKLIKLGYICHQNYKLSRVELDKIDFALAEQIQKYEAKEITGLDLFNYLYEDFIKVISIDNRDETFMGVAFKEGNKFIFPYPERVVIDKNKIVEYLKNGASISVSDISTINIVLA